MSQHDDADLEKFLKGESAISELYKRGSQDGPSAVLDQEILARAQQVVDEDSALPIRKPRPAWLVPLSVAATMVLGINLAFNLRDFRQDSAYEESNGLVFSDSVRSPSGQVLSQSAPSPIANSPATNAPAESRIVPDLDQAPDRVTELHTTESEPDRQRASSEDIRDQQRRIQQAITTGAGREPLRGNANSAAPIAQDESDQNSAFARPPPALAARKLLRESALRVEEDLAQVQRQEQRSNTPAPETPARQAGEADTAFVPETNVSQGGLRQLQTVPQAAATTTTGSSIPEIKSTPLSEKATAAADPDMDMDIDRNISTVEALSASDEVGDPMPGDYVSPMPAPSAAYLCDLKKLRISQDVVNQTRRDALTAVPPLTARNWILEIRRLASEEAYADACRNLAAYIATFGRSESTEHLSVKFPE